MLYEEFLLLYKNQKPKILMSKLLNKFQKVLNISNKKQRLFHLVFYNDE